MPQHFLPTILSFLDYLKFQKRYSPHTILAYENDLFSFFDFVEYEFDAKLITEISGSYVRTWLASLKEAGMEAKSINRKISSLKSFFKFQLQQGNVMTSPMVVIISPKIKKRLPQFIEEKATELLFTHMEFPNDWDGKTHHLILQILYNTGMRQAELITLQELNVDIGNQTIKVIGKGNKERILPVSKRLMTYIKEYIDAKKQNLESFDCLPVLVNAKGKALYPKYVYNAVKNYLSLVTTVDKKSPHILRHTFATHLMNGGAELNAVKELLGHSSLAATQIYTHNSIEKLKEVHKKAHPKA